eukprot:CAMPEP_0183314706 /NCGR_PEP_ID=MMETSP0160_2-20130417/49335_1 /TAXON_ID=2839 ORGANISM="Odontella Sinensis, Strain Grunow 1884" /NCGR_SAMPLE_ID=MMETSP0160_2 /ASSEMBLY_ACC=CAM_ASM_000250 /LENGTH=95 /DNA_ID=CAMNT_0025480099 /DNA_START=468 /DNA_END=756 /DNA_ORIENTATION=+
MAPDQWNAPLDVLYPLTGMRLELSSDDLRMVCSRKRGILTERPLTGEERFMGVHSVSGCRSRIWAIGSGCACEEDAAEADCAKLPGDRQTGPIKI